MNINNCFNKLVAFVANHAGRPRPVAVKLLSLMAGFLMFLVVIPLILGLAAHFLAVSIPAFMPRVLEFVIGLTFILTGLFFLCWSAWTFWFTGGGTPVPFASPVKLVTTGPFRYTRNPIKLGASLIYFGLGAVIDTFMTGLMMFIVILICGAIYHKVIEERELAIRFGDAYESYRRRTPFIIPRPPSR